MNRHHRTADDHPRDRKRTKRAKAATLRRRGERRAKRAMQGRER